MQGRNNRNFSGRTAADSGEFSNQYRPQAFSRQYQPQQNQQNTKFPRSTKSIVSNGNNDNYESDRAYSPRHSEEDFGQNFQDEGFDQGYRAYHPSEHEQAHRDFGYPKTPTRGWDQELSSTRAYDEMPGMQASWNVNNLNNLWRQDNSRPYRGISNSRTSLNTDADHRKGPKGYRRSDERIHEDVCEVLYQHGQVDASDVDVSVAEGHVTLSGNVDSRQAKRQVEEAIENLSGVQDVRNELRVSSR